MTLLFAAEFGKPKSDISGEGLRLLGTGRTPYNMTIWKLFAAVQNMSQITVFVFIMLGNLGMVFPWAFNS